MDKGIKFYLPIYHNLIFEKVIITNYLSVIYSYKNNKYENKKATFIIALIQ